MVDYSIMRITNVKLEPGKKLWVGDYIDLDEQRYGTTKGLVLVINEEANEVLFRRVHPALCTNEELTIMEMCTRIAKYFEEVGRTPREWETEDIPTIADRIYHSMSEMWQYVALYQEAKIYEWEKKNGVWQE